MDDATSKVALELEYRGRAQTAPARRLAGWLVAAASLGALPAFVLTVLWGLLLMDPHRPSHSRELYLMLAGLGVLILVSMAYFVVLVCAAWRVLRGRALWHKWVPILARGYGFLLLLALGLDAACSLIDGATLGVHLHRMEMAVEAGVAVYCLVTVQVNWWMIRACEAYRDATGR